MSMGSPRSAWLVLAQRSTLLCVFFLLGCGGGCRRFSSENTPLVESIETDLVGNVPSVAGKGAAPLESVREIAAVGNATCALLHDGRAVCWGLLERAAAVCGPEEDLPLICKPAPQPLVLPGDARLREISLWDQAMGVTEEGQLMIWGRFLAPFRSDEVGEYKRQNAVLPVVDESRAYETLVDLYPQHVRRSSKGESWIHQGLVDSIRPLSSGIRGVERLVDGGCLVGPSGRVVCLNLAVHRGLWDALGPFDFENAESVSIRGPFCACVREAYGAVSCWCREPDGGWGEVWDGESRFRDDSKLRIPLPRPALDLSIGHVVCAALTDGSVACWGIEALADLQSNTVGRLHVDVREDVDARIVETGPAPFACAITTAGRVKCWIPRIPPPTAVMPPEWEEATRVREIPRIEKAKALAAGSSHACALSEDGRVWCWGNNEYGQLGSGTLGDWRTEHAPALVVSAIEPFGEGEDQQ